MRTADLLAEFSEIRRANLIADLNALIEVGKVARIAHGLYSAGSSLRASEAALPAPGAALPASNAVIPALDAVIPAFTDSIYQKRLAEGNLQKAAVARYIVKTFFQKDGVFGLDSGTGVTLVFRELVNNRPTSAIKVYTNNLHGACLVPEASHIDVTIAGGKIVHQYGAIAGVFEPEWGRLDCAILGFSRITAGEGVYTFEVAQWPWKRSLIEAASRVVFAGELSKIGHKFHQAAMHDLKGVDFVIVAHHDASALAKDDRARVEQELERFGTRVVLVDDNGDPANLVTTGERGRGKRSPKSKRAGD